MSNPFHRIPSFGVLVAALGLLLTWQPAYCQPQPVEVSAVASRADALPGGRVAIAVRFNHQDGWHIHTNDPVIPKSWGDFPAIATTLDITLPAGLQAGRIQWPTPTEIKLDLAGTGRAERYAVFDGYAVAFVPISIAPDATPGPRQIKIAATYQACTDRMCVQAQTDELEATITVLATGATPGPEQSPELFAALDPAGFSVALEKPQSPEAGQIRFNELGGSFSIESRGFGLVLLMLLSMLGGLVLNLTPCVLPVIPIKIMGLSQAAGNPRRTLVLGLMTSLGIVAFWLALGVLVAGVRWLDAVSQLFGNPYFNLGIAGFIAIMALGMMGLFAIQLPQAVYAITPSHGSIGGSFFFGIMTAVLGTPCFGPFAGAAAGAATKLPVPIALGAFTCIGVGMALPYLVLSARPQWLEKVPRTGPAGDLVKQVMGLLLLAAGAYFAGSGLMGLVAEQPYIAGVLYWWAVALLAGIAGLWLGLRTFQITRSGARRALFALIGTVIGGLGILWAGYQTRMAKEQYVAPDSATTTGGLWRPYSEQAEADALAAGKIVVIDFTAAWCLTCKAMDALLHTDTVRDTLSAPDVVALRADLTSRTAPGWARLKKADEVGIPLLIIEGPGTPDVFKANTTNAGTIAAEVSARRAK